VGQLKGLENNNDDVAINIKLKSGKINFGLVIFQREQIVDRFIINPKLFYYSPKTSINVISNFNNIGDVPFSNRDYFRLTGGSRNTIGRNGTNFNISSNDLGISTQRDDKAKSIDNKFGAINIAQQMSKTGILVVSEYFLQIKQYRHTDENRNIPAQLYCDKNK
jgi:hypothetical protein